ncbi:MAG: hypothetical protein HY931_03140 [Candidatus Falkowbacteria bacterium]|nr:MAG: hypothetical protein HY931_03140 [Candidatus Falkowbacteria bacterium]
MELEGLHECRLVISRVPELLIAALEAMTLSWLENSSNLGATNIQLMTVDDYQKLEHPYRGAHPFLCCYPERNGSRPPTSGFHEPQPLFESRNYEHLTNDYKKLVMMNKLKSLINSHDFMSKQVDKYESVYGQIVPALSPEERLQKTFILEFSDNYENSFLSISLAKQPTRNRWD